MSSSASTHVTRHRCGSEAPPAPTQPQAAQLAREQRFREERPEEWVCPRPSFGIPNLHRSGLGNRDAEIRRHLGTPEGGFLGMGPRRDGW